MHLIKHFKELTIRPKNARGLKELILHLAVQGKLTANWRKENPNVEPASELLKRINKNKEVLIKTKKVRIETAKKEFLKDRVSFQIPDTWVSMNITEFYYTIGSKYNQIKSKDYNETGKYPIVSQGKNKIDGYSDDETKLLKITKPVIVFGDHTRIVKFIDFNFIIGADGTKILNPFDGIDSYFFYLHSLYFDLSNKGYARHYSLLKQEAFCLPPQEEQKAIVEVVEILFKEVEQLELLSVERITLKEKFVASALNQLATNNTKKEWAFLQEHFHPFFNEATNIKKLRETVLQLAVQGKLTSDSRSNNHNIEEVKIDKLEKLRRSYQINASKIKGQKSFRYQDSVKIDVGGKSKGVDSLFEIPKSWAWVSLGQIAWSINDGPHFSPNYVDKGVPMISGRNVSFENGIDFTSAKYVSTHDHLEFTKRGKPEVGDVLLTKGGTTGIPCVVETTKEFSVWVHVALIKVIKEFIDPYYLKMALASPFIYRQSQEQTHGIGNKDLGLTRMIFFAIPLPPIEEQKAIVQKVNALMGLCDSLELQVQQSQEQSDQLMQSCLREVFEGETKTK